MYLGWYDPDKHRSAIQKARDAVVRYREKFRGEPETCLTGDVDAAAIGEEFDGIAVRAVPHIPRSTFYVGIDDEPAPPTHRGADDAR